MRTIYGLSARKLLSRYYQVQTRVGSQPRTLDSNWNRMAETVQKRNSEVSTWISIKPCNGRVVRRCTLVGTWDVSSRPSKPPPTLVLSTLKPLKTCFRAFSMTLCRASLSTRANLIRRFASGMLPTSLIWALQMRHLGHGHLPRYLTPASRTLDYN